MQVYFFHIEENGERLPDQQGMAFDGLFDAHAHAVEIAVIFLRQVRAADAAYTCAIQIADAKGKCLEFITVAGGSSD